ncbi:hypothetical protein GPALN_004036 [Globodera pallida]|nr:hypothetical protein GPALN_004036 [Globodera pallida]
MADGSSCFAEFELPAPQILDAATLLPVDVASTSTPAGSYPVERVPFGPLIRGATESVQQAVAPDQATPVVKMVSEGDVFFRQPVPQDYASSVPSLPPVGVHTTTVTQEGGSSFGRRLKNFFGCGL